MSNLSTRTLLAGAAVIAVGAATFATISGIPGPNAAVQLADIAPAAGEAPVAGDPVVAKVNGKDIKRSDVETFIKSLPAPMNEAPIEQIFAPAQEQLVNNLLVGQEAEKTDIAKDPLVERRMTLIRQNLINGMFLEREIEKKMTDEALKAEYDEIIKTMVPVEETKAQHILVDSEEKAKEVIAKLDAGAKFDDLVKEYSKDKGSGDTGDLGYFTKDQMVPAFAQAAFDTKAGTYTKIPVKSDYGWHVILVNDHRTRTPEKPKFEDVKEQIKGQLKEKILREILGDYRKGANVELFDIKGAPLVQKQEGTPAPAPVPAPAPEQPAQEKPAQ